MVKATELRIGNYVWGVSDRKEQIAELFRERVTTSFRGNLLNISDYEDLSPIVVNEKVFEECGLPEYELGYYRLTENTLINVDGYVYYENDDNSTDYLCECHNLHSLQNLYFSLTGEELAFKS